jgi:hypothetical protein
LETTDRSFLYRITPGIEVQHGGNLSATVFVAYEDATKFDNADQFSYSMNVHYTVYEPVGIHVSISRNTDGDTFTRGGLTVSF